jgi:ribosomal protein S18 acetylase RimI-like enzyme
VGLELKENNRAELRRMSVDLKYHRLGVGRKLIAKLEEFAKQKAVKAIYLDTISTTTSAISFYERLGWKVLKLFSKPMLSDPKELLSLIFLEKQYE